MKTAFPLSWPDGRPRTRGVDRRTNYNFKQTFAASRDGCALEIRRLGGEQLIISSNVPLKTDGLPFAMDWGSNRTKQGQPIGDPGVAVYFFRKGKQLCFACDRWAHIQDNMHAITLTIADKTQTHDQWLVLMKFGLRTLLQHQDVLLMCLTDEALKEMSRQGNGSLPMSELIAKIMQELELRFIA